MSLIIDGTLCSFVGKMPQYLFKVHGHTKCKKYAAEPSMFESDASTDISTMPSMLELHVEEGKKC